MQAWMKDEGLAASVQSWFSAPLPEPKIPPGQVRRWMRQTQKPQGTRWLWLGGDCQVRGQNLELIDELGNWHALEGDKRSLRAIEAAIHRPPKKINEDILEYLQPLGLVWV
jgi:hypothetical protein